MSSNIKYGVYIANFGKGWTANDFVGLAKEAEKAGWDGFFLWDHLYPADMPEANAVDPFVALAAELPEGLSTAGLLDSSITLEKKKEGYHILTDATNIKNLVIAQPNVEPFRQEQINLTADILCDPQAKTVAINTLNLESKQDGSLIKVTKGTLTQSSEKDKTRLEGQFQAEYDLKTVSSMASAFVPEGLTMEGKRTASLEFESEYR